MFEVQSMDESGVDLEINKVKRVIERYANGGLDYINKQVKSDPALIERELFFIELLAEAKG